MLKEKLNTYIEASREEMVKAVARLVSIPSVEAPALESAPYGEAVEQARCAAADIAKDLGFRVRNFDGHAVTAELNEKPAKLGIISHLDVVAPGSGWSTPPFEMTLKDGYMYGRGTADDKGPLVASLYALKAVKECCGDLPHGVRLIFGTAEETGSRDMDYYLSKEDAPPMSFTPDADYPVTNIEKGMFMPHFSASWERETAIPRVIRLQGGTIHNAVPDTTDAVLVGMGYETVKALCDTVKARTGVSFDVDPTEEGLSISAHGLAAHVCEPYKGKNAQTALLELLAMLPLADCASSRSIRALAALFPVQDYKGETLGLHHADEITGEMAVTFSVMRLDETGLTGQLDCRLPLCCTEENTASVIRAKLSEGGFTVNSEDQMTPGHYTDPNSEICTVLNRIYEEYTPYKGECISIGGYTYAHNIPGAVAFGCALPGAEPHFHTADERFSVDDMLLSAKMFARAIVEICG